MKILVLEDERLVAESLMRSVRQIEPAAEMTGPIASVQAAERVLAESSFDLIIADIQLADGISLDLFTRRKMQCPVIFTTAFDEYAVRAFKINSIDYLLKPVDKAELETAFEKFHLLQQKFGNETYRDQLAELFGNFRQSKKYKERFAVHAGRNLVLVNAADVVCFVKEEIIFLVNEEGRRFITDYRSLDEVEELLDPHSFFRANRQFIVHLPYIGHLRSDESGKIAVKMKQPSLPEVLISKEKAATFRRWVEG